jgi:hypothetical protein
MPDGSRGEAWHYLPMWRRRGNAPMVWIYGRLVLNADDVEFVDSDEQPRYIPPPLSDTPNLEAELARSEGFIADIQDDAFALTAFVMLTELEWMKVGHREFEQSGTGDIAEMIAGLRRKGESYSDVRNETLGGRNTSMKNYVTQEHVQRLHVRVAEIGWRTHTADELHAIFVEDLRQRLQARVEVLRKVKSFETRNAAYCECWTPKGSAPGLVLFLHENDDITWLGELSSEQEEAISSSLSRRVVDLALNGRMNRTEYNELLRKVGAKIFNLEDDGH